MTPRFLHNLLLRYRSTGFSAMFTPRKPRHPLLRFLFGVTGIALLAVLLVCGVVVGAAMLAAGLAMRLLGGNRSRPGNAARGTVLDGDYRVVDKPLLR